MSAHVLQLLSLAGVWVLAVMLPGPNCLLIVKTALDGRREDGLAAALGISLGAVIWSSASLFGLAILFQQWQWLYEAIRVVGGMYIFWIGLRTVRSGFASGANLAPCANGEPPAREGRVLVGLLTSLSNPKTAVFFTSMFASLLSPHAPLWVPITAVCVVFCISMIWYSGLALAFARPCVRRGYNWARRPVDVALGGLFMLLGGRLATRS